MKDRQQKLIRSLTGHFLGWENERDPARYIKLATAHGERVVKVAKSLRLQIQDWQPGIEVNLLIQERIDRSTGERKIKVKQLLAIPSVDAAHNRLGAEISPPKLSASSIASVVVAPTTIKVCQGSSCRRRGSERICQTMQAYFERHDLTDTVQIEMVKCLHQCKAAPHAIVVSPDRSVSPGKTHYRQLQPTQVQVILAKHFPIDAQPESIGSNIIEKIGDYIWQHQTAIARTLPQL
jgi:(2Fe-2S) ferredoxin